MSMPLPGEIRYPSTAANREMRWEREHRAIHVSEVTHRTYRDFRRTRGNRCSPCGTGTDSAWLRPSRRLMPPGPWQPAADAKELGSRPAVARTSTKI